MNQRAWYKTPSRALHEYKTKLGGNIAGSQNLSKIVGTAAFKLPYFTPTLITLPTPESDVSRPAWMKEIPLCTGTRDFKFK